MDELKALRERVAACTGEDLTLDYEIWTALFGLNAGLYIASANRYTASIDACVSLIEGVLPGEGEGWWEVDKSGDATVVAEIKYVRAEDPTDIEYARENFKASGATPPLALLSALMSALVSKEAAK